MHLEQMLISLSGITTRPGTLSSFFLSSSHFPDPQFPRETYGRWAELIKATNPGVFDQGQEQVRTTDEPPASTQCPAAATAEWLLTSNPSTTPTFTTTNETNEAQASGSNPVKTKVHKITQDV